MSLIFTIEKPEMQTHHFVCDNHNSFCEIVKSVF